MTRDFSEATTHPEKVRPASAVSRWSMDSSDVSSGVISDSWGSNDGTLNGGITTGASGIGGSEAFSFDGSDGEVYCSGPAGVPTGSSSRTVSVWAKIRNVSNGDGDIIAGYGGTSSKNENFQLGTDYNSGSSKFVLYRNGTSYDWVTSVDAKDFEGEWHHYVMIWDNPDGVEKLFIDGVKVDSRFPSNTPGTDDEQINIGAESNDGARYGDILADELRIYSEALNQQQIWKLYNIGRNANWGYTRS